MKEDEEILQRAMSQSELDLSWSIKCVASDISLTEAPLSTLHYGILLRWGTACKNPRGNILSVKIATSNHTCATWQSAQSSSTSSVFASWAATERNPHKLILVFHLFVQNTHTDPESSESGTLFGKHKCAHTDSVSASGIKEWALNIYFAYPSCQNCTPAVCAGVQCAAPTDS